MTRLQRVRMGMMDSSDREEAPGEKNLNFSTTGMSYLISRVDAADFEPKYGELRDLTR